MQKLCSKPIYRPKSTETAETTRYTSVSRAVQIRKKCREGKGEKEEELGFGLSMDDEFEGACGRKPINPNAKEDEIIMLEWVWELYGTGNLLKSADPRLCGNFDQQQMERLMMVGLWRTHPDSIARPSIRKAIHVLDFEIALPILEPKIPVPTYLMPAVRASTSSDFVG
uniref:Uncharacterized protein n=1 Tax=Quercus lobata TaxID=97700 RepID=A0A7N2RDB9_QUELO